MAHNWVSVRACVRARPGYAKCTCASPASCWRVHPLWDRLHDQWSVSSECWESSRAARAAADSLWNIHHQLCFIFLRIHLKSAVRVFQFPPVMRTDTQTSRYQTAWEVNVTSSLRAHTHTHTHTHTRTHATGRRMETRTHRWMMSCDGVCPPPRHEASVCHLSVCSLSLSLSCFLFTVRSGDFSASPPPPQCKIYISIPPCRAGVWRMLPSAGSCVALAAQVM